ncbi:MAG: DUF4199 domain-containing protein [Bacteroidaceae bacterium]|jgi:hypothetical protein|nr:DUF4199 domain-containing protein [Bacteroidaceae bacterium]
MDFELYKISREFSLEYGTILGIIWLITFFTCMNGMMGGGALLMLFGMGFMGISALMPFYLAWRYKQHLKPGDRVPMGIAWLFSALMFFYASIIAGVGEYIYFQYIDKGRAMEYFMQFLSSPETEAQYKTIGASELLEQSKTALAELANLTPLDLTLNIFANNLFIALLLSLPVAFVAHRKCHDIRLSVNELNRHNNNPS